LWTSANQTLKSLETAAAAEIAEVNVVAVSAGW
jgi:hypothetical protein